MLDDILIEVGAAVIAALIGLAWLAVGARGVAFTESTTWGGLDDLPVEHLGPPPPGAPPPAA